MKYIGLFDEKEDIVTKEKLDAVSSRVSTNEDNIAMAESDIEGLQTAVGTLQTNVNNVQTALASKQDTVVGGASTITEDNLTASRALVSNSSGKVAVSTVTSTELGYLDGVTSNVQTQLNSKQPTITVNGIIKGDGAGNLSAQDTVAAELVDLPTVPTKVSELTNDANYITAAQAPVQSVNNKTGAVSLTASDVEAIPSTLTGTAGQVLTKTADGQEWKDATPRDIFFGVEGFLQDQDVLLLDPDGFSDLTSQWNQLVNAGHSPFTTIDIPMPCIDVQYNADSENTIVLRYAGLLENQAIFSGIYYDAMAVGQYAISLLYGLGGHGFSQYNIIPIKNIDPSTTTPLAPTPLALTEDGSVGGGSVGTSTTYARGDHIHPSEVFICHIQKNSSTDLACDRTYAEIVAAYTAGKICIARLNNSCLYLNYYHRTKNLIHFLGTGRVSNSVIEIDINDNITLSTIRILPLAKQITLYKGAWDGSTKQQLVTVSGVLADPTLQEIRVMPVNAALDSPYIAAGVQCVAQATDSLTFGCETIPTEAIEVYVVIQYVDYSV